MIFDIQRFSTNDGPGIRTVVFFKGCTLRCMWCENPESQNPLPELLYTHKDCIGCHSCLRAANGGAVRPGSDKKIEVVREKTPPLSLQGVCPVKALRVAGWEASTEEIMNEVRKDRSFYAKSGGGLTLSGGEPLSQIDSALELIQTALGEGFDVAVETCLAVSRDTMRRVRDVPVHWLVDLKHTDPVRFREGTGGDASLVLENIRSLSETSADITFRVPLIPGFNDDERSVLSIFSYIVGLPRPAGVRAATGRRVDILPYHDLAAGKFAALGRQYPYRLGLRLEHGFIETCAKMGRSLGLEIKIGG